MYAHYWPRSLFTKLKKRSSDMLKFLDFSFLHIHSIYIITLFICSQSTISNAASL